MSADQGLAPGTLLENRYRIRGLLGQGGMSRVYLADDTRLGVRVAVKENLQTTAEARAQFEREARLLASLSHPNIPRVIDRFTDANTRRQYLVMEYIEGEDLAGMIRRVGPLSEPMALAWVRQILNAVEYLHSQQPPIIHRDIKPANIKITPQGKAMLVDFGIAKFYDPSRGTMTGLPAVTAGYAPPEQYSLRTTQRSDIYALGATLYTMLTGQVPPDAPLRQAGEDVLVAPRRLAGSVSEQTEHAILRAMEVENTRRWQSVGELRAALEGRVVTPPPVPQPLVGIQRRPASIALPALLILLALICIGITCIFGTWMSSTLPSERPTPVPIPVAVSTKTRFLETPTQRLVTITPLPTTLILFEDDFVDNRNEWWQAGASPGTSYIEGGAYNVKQTVQRQSYFPTCEKCGTFSDFVFEAMITKVEGTDDVEYGLAFRMSDSPRVFYSFGIFNGGWEFLKLTADGWRWITQWTPNNAVNKGNSTNKLRVVCRGSKFEFFVNDQFVGSAMDDTFSSGYVGVGVGAAGQHIRVEYVRLWRTVPTVPTGMATSSPTRTQASGVPTPTPPSSTAPSAFIFGAQGEPVCLDPAVITDGMSARVTNQIFEGLVRFDKDTTNVIPSLAEKWTVSDDGKVWTFTLRKGVKFHDGTDFNAQTVAKNWDYWKNSKNPLHTAQERAGQTFEYYEFLFGGFDDDSIITKVEAVDLTTVKFTLKEPQGSFLNNLAMFAFVFWSPTALEKAVVDSCKKPVGTGPYKFIEWKPNESVTLEAFADYWDKTNAPRMKRVVIRNIPNNSTRLMALAAGEIHGMEGLEPRDVATVKVDRRFKLLLRPANTTGYVAFNYKVKEFQDIKVRQAFAQAINKAMIVDKYYGGTGMVAKEFQPPALWGYNKDIEDLKYDTAAAKKLLADAGFPNGISEVTFDSKKVPLDFWYMPVSRSYYPNPKDIATAIAADWAKAGITVQLQTADWVTYLTKRRDGQLLLYMLGWTGDNGDPDNFVCYSFCMDANDTPITREGFVADKEVSDILKKAAVLTNQAERARFYQQAEKLIHDKVLRIFIAHNQPPLAFLANVEGYIPNPIGMEYFNTVAVK